METLELCQEHKGPLVPDTIHRLDTLSDEQVMAEASYLKKTIAPNLRYKYKFEGKFVKFSINQIKLQIKDVIQPEDTVSNNPPKLLTDLFTNDEKPVDNGSNNDGTESGCSVGSLGIWEENASGERKVGMKVEGGSLQMFREKRHGLVPFGLLEASSDWTFKQEITDDIYEIKNNIIYLVLMK